MNLRNYRIGTRLGVGFGSILAIMLVALLASTYMDERSRTSLASALASARAKETVAAEMRVVSLAQSEAMRNIALHSEVKAMQDEEARARKLGARYDELASKLGKQDLSEPERALLNEILSADKALDRPLMDALALATGFHGEDAAKVLVTEIDPLVQRSHEALERLIELQGAANERFIAAAQAEGVGVRRTVSALALALTFAAAAIAWFTTRSITGPLGESVAVTRRVTAGDLTASIGVTGRDEPAQLQAALRDMNAGLGAMVRQIRAGSESIAVSANQVAAGNESLASRTEEHASSLEETASTLEEFASTVKQSADHARHASALAASASDKAQHSGAAAAEVVKTMQDVKASSSRVAEIVGVIDAIAFQTNILALNAAVEAAHAGDQGRGFAVVATEVRNLAKRSAASASEIRILIKDSVQRVEHGTTLAESAAASMEQLVTTAKGVADIMGEIAAAGIEQSAGIEQINETIAQMDQVVQLNAALVEETMAAAASMASQASDLTISVARFRTDEEPTQRRSVPVTARTPERIARPVTPALRAARVAHAVVGETAEWEEF